MDTKRYLEKIRAANGGCSDYKLAQIIGVRQQTVSNYMTGNRTLDDDVAVAVAELLGISPLQVIADCSAERAARANNVKLQNLWQQVARLATQAACVVALVLGSDVLSHVGHAGVADQSVISASVGKYTMRPRRLGPWWLLRIASRFSEAFCCVLRAVPHFRPAIAGDD